MLDSRGANVAFYNAFRERFGLPAMSEAEEEYVHAHPVQESLRHILPTDLHGRIDEARAEMDYRQVLPALYLEPGLVELLGLLKSMGVRLAVNTNRTTTMELVLDHFGLRGFFELVVTAGKVAWPKPHPESLHKVLGIWGLPASEVAFIGDSSVDMDTAFRAGVPFWAYRNPALKAETHIESFPALLACIRRDLAFGRFRRGEQRT
jgi:HAD superfamily hydrolase (TIGR01509 family)